MSDHCFVIPAYKESPYLESCINSLLQQTVKSRIVLTTSTPSPFLQALAERYKLGYYINPEPGSIASDWNFALSKADSKTATIAHQDDLYEPEYAEAILNGIKSHRDVLIAFTSYTDLVAGEPRKSSLNVVIKAALLWPFLFSKHLSSKWAKKAVLLWGDPIACPAVTFNLELLKDFAFSKEYTCALDWDAWLKLSQKKGAFLYVNKKLMHHRIHAESETTNQLSLGLRQKEEFQIFERMWGKGIAKMLSKVYAAGYKDNEL